MEKYSSLIFLILVTILLTSCVYHDVHKPTQCDQSDLTLTLDSVKEATSCGVFDGYILVTAQGGIQPYSFSWNDHTRQESGIFSGFGAGTYTISVTDGIGCVATLSNVLIMAKDISFSTEVLKDSLCLDHSGAITISILDGNFPFTFQLNGGEFSNDSSFSGLKYGTHLVSVKDNAGCIIQLNIDVPRGKTGTSWLTDILPIMKTSCALNGCHDGKSGFDFRIYQNVKNAASSVKSKTQDGSMPFDGTALPQNQIDQIACWVDDGAPEN